MQISNLSLRSLKLGFRAGLEFCFQVISADWETQVTSCHWAVAPGCRDVQFPFPESCSGLVHVIAWQTLTLILAIRFSLILCSATDLFVLHIPAALPCLLVQVLPKGSVLRYPSKTQALNSVPSQENVSGVVSAECWGGDKPAYHLLITLSSSPAIPVAPWAAGPAEVGSIPWGKGSCPSPNCFPVPCSRGLGKSCLCCSKNVPSGQRVQI